MSAKKKAEFLFDMAGWACVGALAGAADYFYKVALTPKKHDPSVDKEPGEIPYARGRKWMNSHERRQDIFISSGNGLQLHANYIPAEDPECHRYAICVHGYGDSAESMGLYARRYLEMYGMNVLLPDLRGHGASEGSYVGMGYPDSGDLIRWIDWIIGQDQKAVIVLHGISMGAATILLATGQTLPSQVRAAVADSSYTSAMDEFRYLYSNMRNNFFPAKLILQAVRIICLVRARYDLEKASPVKAVGTSKTPTIFIHGEDDDSVPPSMMPRLFEAADCKKEFVWVAGAKHVQSVNVNPEMYWGRIEKFFKKLSPWILNDKEDKESPFEKTQ